jgi:hypothetical protein
MNKFKRFIANTFFKELLPSGPASPNQQDASSKGGAKRELASEFVKTVVYKTTDDNDYESPDFDMTDIEEAYDTDSYIRQGVDKYVDQLFKEGYSFYGKDTNIVDYLRQRMSYIAEATGTPTNQFLIDIAEDIVKYGNAMIVKSRNSDQNALPQGVSVTGLGGGEPIVGYYCANPSTMTCMRDEYGTITKWQQETDAGTQEFNPEDVVHFYYKRKKGNAYGTSFLVPVLDDVRALRQAEENVLKMMYRNIYPFHHVRVGTEEEPGTETEVEKMATTIDDMEIDGGIVTTERVEIKAIAANQVINAEPYLRYMEERVFSGMGIPEIMFGRGDTANRSTGDNMTSEMADRIRAIHRIIESFFNEFIIKELLMEGGYDPVLNPDQKVELKFNDNDIDVLIKKEVHAIYKYEHNAITEDEMRLEIGMDPIEDSAREHMYVELITKSVETHRASLSPQQGTAETNNKQKNGGGNGQGNKKATDPSAKSTSKSGKDSNNYAITQGLLKDSFDKMFDELERYVKDCYNFNRQIIQNDVQKIIVQHSRDMCYTLSVKIDDKTLYNKLQDMIVQGSTKFCNDFHQDLVGTSTYHTHIGSTLDMLNIRLNIFKDSMLGYLKNKESAIQYIT